MLETLPRSAVHKRNHPTPSRDPPRLGESALAWGAHDAPSFKSKNPTSQEPSHSPGNLGCWSPYAV